MRILRAKQVSTNKWLHRVDSGDKATTVFLADCAEQFGVPVGDVEAVETEWTETQRQTAVTELAAGTHEGLAIIAPAPGPVYDPLKDQTKVIKALAIWMRQKVNELRALHSLSAITAAQQRNEITTILNGL